MNVGTARETNASTIAISRGSSNGIPVLQPQTLQTENSSAVAVAGARLEQSVLDAGLRRRIRFEQVRADATQDRKVLGGVVDANPALVFAEGHVQHSVQSALDTPMRPHGLRDSRCVGRQARHVVRPLDRLGIADLSSGLDHHDRTEAGP